MTHQILVSWVDSAQDRDYSRTLVNGALELRIPEVLDLVNIISIIVFSATLVGINGMKCALEYNVYVSKNFSIMSFVSRIYCLSMVSNCVASLEISHSSNNVHQNRNCRNSAQRPYTILYAITWFKYLWSSGNLFFLFLNYMNFKWMNEWGIK